ncbi:MAG TPA: carboxypeptidase regulatory-like domain-containing protein, partial [Bryobacteraceae bacterium]|nr:carboxypeptidase regulatory-like domain-containing protein [Bryobacteraceae bacterium]
MKYLLKAGVCLVCAALLAPVVLRAQSGVVKSEGLPIPGATVKATQGERVLLTVTDGDGAFHIDKLTPGAWIIEADMFGFQHFRKEVTIGEAAQKIDITLQLREPRAARGGRGGAAAGDDTSATEFTAGGTGGAAVEAPPVPDVGAEASNPSFNLQGSISQGAETTNAD